MREWVIFDGDNTLWDVEILYDQAREQLCTTLANVGADPEVADRFQRTRDAELHTQLGYSPDRFPQSFTDTVRHCLGRSDATLEHRARELAKEVFRAQAPLAPDVDEALQRLTQRYLLALLTAGDEAVQTQRLVAFRRTDHFHAIRIVPSKSVATLQSFVDDHGISGSHAWVVGDSLRSDIEPAIALGIRAIHLEVPNWHLVERGDRTLPAGAHRAESLLDVCAILGC